MCYLCWLFDAPLNYIIHCAHTEMCNINPVTSCNSQVLIGMGATILNRAVIGRGSVVGAGALVLEGMEVPPFSLVVGSPAKAGCQDGRSWSRMCRMCVVCAWICHDMS